MDTLNRLEESTHYLHIINFIEESIKKENFKYIAFGRNIYTCNNDIEPNFIFEVAKIKLESYLKMVKQYMNEPIYQSQDIDNKIKRIEDYLNSKYILQSDTYKDKNIEMNETKTLCIEDDISKNLNETKEISVDIESTMTRNYVDLNNKLDQQTIPIEDLNLNNSVEYNNKVLLDNNLINEKLKEDLLVLAGEMKNSALKFGKLMEKDKEVLLSIDNQQIINIEQTSKSIYELKNYSRYIIFIKCQSIPWLKGYQGYQRNIKPSYDFIIVGAGASGCALARTLADAKYSVLLVERGGTRVEGSELSLSIDGTGRVISDNKVSQLVITNNSVRTNIGIGLGGGTAINMGIVIKEDPNFFNFLEAYSGAKLNMSLLEESYDWIIKNVSNRSDQSIPIVEPLKEAFGDIGFITDENKDVDFSLSKINGTWRAYNIFNTSDNNFRMASDVLLADIQAVKDNSIIEKSPVDILTNHVVTKIELTNETTSRNTNNFRSNPISFLPYQFPNLDGFIKNEIRQDTNNMNQTSLVATCILLNKVNIKSGFPDILRNSSISNIFSTVNSISNWAESFLPSQEWKFGVNIPSSADIIGNVLAKRICINKGGMIILSAGTIFTPLLLYRSGIGPIDRLRRLNISPILNVPNLGTNMVDRLLYAIPIFIRKDVKLHPFINPLMASISDDVKKDCGYNCDVINIESIGGGKVVEGTLYATRLIFPPSLRSNIVTNFLMDLFKSCANFAPVSYANPACIILEYPIQCLRRSVAIFYFQGEPKSRATIEVDNYGKVSLSGNYLHNNEDQLNAIKGISSLIKMVRSGKFDNIAEPGGYQSCPFAILNGILNIVGSMRNNQEDYGQPRTSVFSEAVENIFFALTSYRLSIMPQTCINNNNSKQCKSNVNYERVATFPPLLPNLDDPQKILSFAQKIGTSLWHWAGAAPLGEIVENDSFILSGTKNLGIVDASLLKILPRTNPMILIMAIGRYAGLSILNNKSKNKD
ncbi:hypothetical protein cand_033320 [Cryptosporidium andersoni]|uniref:Glucose-methanol-choline oxidoreductase N-terminal domain-containing protein n=1 Tax=Cryptosporidium andersoni TaxID=117008 RepID=A0A1J4MDS3_9CRYT|nr:hypothetical protein cand_033320 [Cryptosporidium andersoni]